MLSMDWRHYELDISAAWSDDSLSSESLQQFPCLQTLAAELMLRYLCPLSRENVEDRMPQSHCMMVVAAQVKPSVQVIYRLRQACQQRCLRPAEAPSGVMRWLASTISLVRYPMLQVSWT